MGSNEMRALSAFTGVPVVVSGFEEANEMHAKKELLKGILRKNSGADDSQLEALIADRLREEQPTQTVSPIIGKDRWFKRLHDGGMFRCEASVAGVAAVRNDSTNEVDVLHMKNGGGWKSQHSPHAYVRVPEIKKIAKQGV